MNYMHHQQQENHRFHSLHFPLHVTRIHFFLNLSSIRLLMVLVLSMKNPILDSLRSQYKKWTERQALHSALRVHRQFKNQTHRQNVQEHKRGSDQSWCSSEASPAQQACQPLPASAFCRIVSPHSLPDGRELRSKRHCGECIIRPCLINPFISQRALHIVISQLNAQSISE